MTIVEKKPVQVYLGQRHRNILNQLAQRLGISQAEVWQRGLESLAREVLPVEEDPAWQLIGLAGEDTDSPIDFSVGHDRYLAEESSND